MPEQLQTRTEHSRSVADAEKYRAIHTLTELGMLVPVEQLETYHGRVGQVSDGEWTVEPSFNNGGHATGLGNVNSRSTLYTGERSVAEGFAADRRDMKVGPRYDQHLEARVRGYGPAERGEQLGRLRRLWNNPSLAMSEIDTDSAVRLETMAIDRAMADPERAAVKASLATDLRAEVHKIVVADADATVINEGFDPAKLDGPDKARYDHALHALALRLTEGSPLSFADRGAAQSFQTALRGRQLGGIMQADEIAKLAGDAGISEPVALQLASAYNACTIFLTNPVFLASTFVRSPQGRQVTSVAIDQGNGKIEVPVNMEYVGRVLQQAHIVGLQQKISSASLNRSVTSVSLFDLHKATTEAQLDGRRNLIWRKLGGLAARLDEQAFERVNADQQPLLRMLGNAYAKPEELMAAAMQVEGYAAIFGADAGNWEGFSLAEHTETVLRNFDENYADKLPVELLPLIRLGIITHDIGKSVAQAQGDKEHQERYNRTQATDFMMKLGVDGRTRDLVLAMIGEGMDLALHLNVVRDVRRSDPAVHRFAAETLKKFYAPDDADESQIDGFIQLCQILQVCDGGAYTSMAVTRPGNGKGYHRNAPRFNKSYEEPTDLSGRDLRRKN